MLSYEERAVFEGSAEVRWAPAFAGETDTLGLSGQTCLKLAPFGTGCFLKVTSPFFRYARALDMLTLCKYNMGMIIELLNHRDPLRILLTLYQRGGLRFGPIQRLLELNPAQVDRALKFLCKRSWIKAYPLPGGARGQTEYRIGKRGAALAEAFTVFAGDIRKKEKEFSPAEVAEFRRFYQPTLTAGKKVYTGKSGLVVKIGAFPPDEAEELAEYRAGGLMLSPKERINRMRALSRRLILLNPANPRSAHIDCRHIKIIHDAIQ